MITPVKPTGANNRISTPKPPMSVMPKTANKSKLGTPGMTTSLNIVANNTSQTPIRQRLSFGPNEGGKRKTQRRKHHRKSKKHTTKSRA